MFKEDLIKQFTKFVITDGKYSSGMYPNFGGIFLERVPIIFFCITKTFF